MIQVFLLVSDDMCFIFPTKFREHIVNLPRLLYSLILVLDYLVYYMGYYLELGNRIYKYTYLYPE